MRAELDAGVAAGYPVINPSWLQVLPLVGVVDPVATATLGEGEAAVIQLAREQSIPRACMDDRKARRFAAAAGLEVVGTLGLLLRAKTLGLAPALRPYLERLLRSGSWYDEALVRRVLEEAGEGAGGPSGP